MKLELKHLAPYLPYGLELWLENRDIKVKLKGLQDDNDVIHNHGKTPIRFLKPILRPLSDLKKIQSNPEWWRRLVDNNMVLLLDYNSVQDLLKEHYDVFGLIDQGLAIDINTLP